MSTYKYSFENDYSEGCHPDILTELHRTNLIQRNGYSTDTYSNETRKLIKEKLENDTVDIHFISGGTQTNIIGLALMLKPYESVIAADTSHIATHETGAIEATGHKINIVKNVDGKIKIKDIHQVVLEHNNTHMVKPKVVFISNSTEYGTIYTKKELEELSVYCKQNNLYLYLDGARLASALMSDKNDVLLSDLTKYCDAFYIGGTKSGALFGEALVIVSDELKQFATYLIKQRGALLAKGSVIALQFKALFENDLFFSLAKKANELAKYLGETLQNTGFQLLHEPISNQVFVILPNSLINQLKQDYLFINWAPYSNDESIIRLVVSWAMNKKVINTFLDDVVKYKK